MRTLLTAALAALVLAAVAVPASAASLTGKDIHDDTTVSFPTRAKGLLGTSLTFGTGTPAGGPVLFRMPILAAGTVANSAGATTISFSVNLTRPTVDHDPTFFVTDGTTAIGIFTGDHGVDSVGDRSRRFVSAPDTGSALSVTFLPFVLLPGGTPAIGGTMDISAEWILTGADSTIDRAELSHVFGALDRSAGLSLLFVGNDSTESYQLNTLDLSITTVPEPGSLPLMLLGGAGLALLRRRRRAARA